MISDEAVEAAAKASGTSVDRARKALDAAAPHMLAEAKAEAWEEGYFAGAYANPYRSQA